MATRQDPLTVCDACRSVLGHCSRKIPCGYCQRLEIKCSNSKSHAVQLPDLQRRPLRIIKSADKMNISRRHRKGGTKWTVENLAMAAFPSERIGLGPGAVMPPGWLMDAIHRASLLEAFWKRLQKDQPLDWTSVKKQRAGASSDSDFYLFDETALLAMSIIAEEHISTLLQSSPNKPASSKNADLETYLSSVLLNGCLPSENSSSTEEPFSDASSDSFGAVLSSSESSGGEEMMLEDGELA